ncbi:TRA1-like protein [Mya arenaria]|uniref:TRA1-like protein n=1 Tax=Mya arenaria TaxID=6604 RepID=A0ABY7ECK8_MYAAR|nr:TRA1-like protein [Mya arenaria]
MKHNCERIKGQLVPMEVRFFGAGGMKASKPNPGLLKQVKMYGADLVVVSLGGNDITTASVPKDIVAAVLDIAQEFLDSGVSTILVLEIGERGAFRDGLGYRSFASQRARINQLLGKSELVEVLRLPHIRFPAEFMRDKRQQLKIISDKVIPDMYTVVRAQVEAKLNDCISIAITTDGWTSRACQSYLTVSVHGLDSNWNLHNYVVATRMLDVSHTGVNVGEALAGVICEFDLMRSSGIAVVSDNAANMDVVAKAAMLSPHIKCLPIP